MTEVSPLSRNLLRGCYLLMIIGLGLVIWPTILEPTQPMTLARGEVVSMLGAMSALALIGLWHPVRMLPLLFFEIGWKLIWLLRIALPLGLARRLDASTTETVYECLGVVIFLAVMPWRHVFATYGRARGEPWRRATG